ncbi:MULTISPECIES: hypothetical protein [Microbacterium]|uniref:hypothetical protein n=1 Tax=Microbacterium TaxID=33882 RepID=UPI001431DBCF|nr:MULTISPECIES: hypothetical protein [Microbacterium]MCK6066391.1 hypothetical protein [Microbacterium sp. EYE_512]
MDTGTGDTEHRSAAEVAALQREWIFGWDRVEGDPLRAFADVFGRYYDFDADVLLFDDADPERRTHRRVADYADAFWPTFSGPDGCVGVAHPPRPDGHLPDLPGGGRLLLRVGLRGVGGSSASIDVGRPRRRLCLVD